MVGREGPTPASGCTGKQKMDVLLTWVWLTPCDTVSHRLFTKPMAPHSSTLAWKIPLMEEPGRLQSMASVRVGHDWVTSLSLFTFMHWRRKWQPTPVFLPGESQGLWSLLGCRSMGSQRVGHDWSDLAAAAAAAVDTQQGTEHRSSEAQQRILSLCYEKVWMYLWIGQTKEAVKSTSTNLFCNHGR